MNVPNYSPSGPKTPPLPNPAHGGSSGIQQVGGEQNPFPLTINDLLSQKVKNRPNTILSIPAAAQQDDGFAALAKDKTLDEGSRLAAAIKIRNAPKRDAILDELAQDQSLDDTTRLKAADKIIDLSQKLALFSALAQDKSLDKIARLEAKAFVELDPNSIVQTQTLPASTSILPIGNEVDDLLLLFAQDKTLDANSRITAADKLSPGETREAILMVLAQDHTLDVKLKSDNQGDKLVDANSRITAADKLAPGETREAILMMFTQDKTLYANSRITAADKLAPGSTREAILMVLVQDLSLHISQRASAADKLAPGDNREQTLSTLTEEWYQFEIKPRKGLKGGSIGPAQYLAPGPKRDNILIRFAKDEKLHHGVRKRAARSISPGDARTQMLRTLHPNQETQETNREDPIETVENMPPGDARDVICMGFVQDSSLDINKRFNIAEKISPGIRRDTILMPFTKSQNSYGVQAAGLLSPGNIRDQILLTFAKDPGLNIVYRVQAAGLLSPSKIRDQILLAFAKDQTVNTVCRIQAAINLK